ncbi:hypothetical protein ABTD69_18620, partial [Acinetobacter baumannii]
HQQDRDQQTIEGDRLRTDRVRRETGDDDVARPQDDGNEGIEKCGFLLEPDLGSALVKDPPATTCRANVRLTLE